MKFFVPTLGNHCKRIPAFWHPKPGTLETMCAVWLTWFRLPRCLLVITVFACAGCSGGETAELPPPPVAFSESELAAFKDSTNSGRDFSQSLKSKMLEKAGVSVSKRSDGNAVRKKAR